MMARTNGKTLGRMAHEHPRGPDVGRADDVRLRAAARGRRQVVAVRVSPARSRSGSPRSLDILWPLWDEENRALHDFIVSTRVVKD